MKSVSASDQRSEDAEEFSPSREFHESRHFAKKMSHVTVTTVVNLAAEPFTPHLIGISGPWYLDSHNFTR